MSFSWTQPGQWPVSCLVSACQDENTSGLPGSPADPMGRSQSYVIRWAAPPQHPRNGYLPAMRWTYPHYQEGKCAAASYGRCAGHRGHLDRGAALALYAALEVCTVDALEHRPDYVLLAPIRYYMPSRCCIAMLHRHAASPCCIVMLHRHAASPCCITHNKLIGASPMRQCCSVASVHRTLDVALLACDACRFYLCPRQNMVHNLF